MPHLTVNYFQLEKHHTRTQTGHFQGKNEKEGGGVTTRRKCQHFGGGAWGRGGGPFFLDLARGLTLSDGFESVQASRIALLAGHLRETKKVTALP